MKGSSTQPAARGWLTGVASVSLCLLFLSGCGGGGRMVDYDGLTELKVGNATLQVTVSRGFADQQRGLKYRTAESLAKDEGMLFIYQTAREAEFTMQDCKMALDAAFLDSDGVITDLYTMQPESGGLVFKKYKASQPATYAIQMAGGWFAAAGVTVGQKVENLPAPGGR